MLAVVLVALVGVRLAAPILQHPGSARAQVVLEQPGATDIGLGQGVRTSFGSLTAAEALVDNGLSSEDLGGMSHGISNLVSTGFAQVNTLVTLTNTSKHPVGIEAKQFLLLKGRNGVPTGKGIKATGTTLHAGELLPGSSVDARVTFITPTDGSALWLQFTDPAGGHRIRISLGQTNVVTAPKAGHQH
jgi:hypothetical protein